MLRLSSILNSLLWSAMNLRKIYIIDVIGIYILVKTLKYVLFMATEKQM